MIQVKIASTLDEVGVGDARWVLVDPSAATASADEPAAPAHGTAPAARRPVWLLRLLSAAVLLAALVAAWWVASAVLEARRATAAHRNAPASVLAGTISGRPHATDAAADDRK